MILIKNILQKFLHYDTIKFKRSVELIMFKLKNSIQRLLIIIFSFLFIFTFVLAENNSQIPVYTPIIGAGVAQVSFHTVNSGSV